MIGLEPPELATIAAAFPKLEIVELIDCAGMGAVYKARQPHLDRFVVPKILPPSLAETPGFTERFTREGRLLAKLSYPAIVGVHDFGQAGGFFFLLMEYVDGVNLGLALAILAVPFEGPDFPGGDRNGHNLIFFGQGREWDVFRDQQLRTNIVTFAFPDRQTAGLAA